MTFYNFFFENLIFSIQVLLPTCLFSLHDAYNTVLNNFLTSPFLPNYLKAAFIHPPLIVSYVNNCIVDKWQINSCVSTT